MKIQTALILSLLLASCSSEQRSPIASATVKITNLESNSGGSGSIVAHSSASSSVLTNSHVCEVVRHGGLVHTSLGERHIVTSFRQSKIHDLCLITVAADLKVSAELASRAPAPMSFSTASGHPRLIPNIITHGHFSDKMVIQIITGFKPCTEEERNNPATGLACMFVGGLPIITSYESIVISNLVQPGSSGSAVYDSSGCIAAVVFAGGGDISFGFAVPYEYVRKFLTVEIKGLEAQVPDARLDFTGKKSTRNDYIKKLTDMCQTNKEAKGTPICKQLEALDEISDLVYYK